ncbi:glycosyltransferase family 4 protein [Sphingomonas sp. IC4-52]|uniref:glycosyltransferase family 4 protein n=1 Tax=Sphingomonas sp. IC4-52 TaxID=2887202 RepID=UPI001D12C107|nr:glycosyltransferase family 4 protein [Sphingomonas sp. IC4-52]MCC2981313.1 glycosyltransferase family 4 protein [Sphingomonas sp. IC4-52]
MRVAFVLAALQAGGAERVVAEVSAGMVAKGWSVEIITFDHPDDPIYHPLDPRVSCTRLALPNQGGGVRGAIRSIRRIAALRRILRERKTDTVIAFLTKINVIALAAGWGLGRSIIVSERNNPLRQKAHPAWNQLTSLLYAHASRIVIMSERSRQALPRASRARAAIIPNPVRPSGLRKVPRTKAFVAVGRLTQQKGFDILLEAFAAISPSLPDWQLIIFGEGPDRDALEHQRAHLGLQDRVLLPGATPVPGSWIDKTSIFVLSSRYEGWPNALAEALAAGLPAIAFDCDFGAAEMVKDDATGVLVPAEDTDALACAMYSLALDPQRRERLGSAASRQMICYSPDRIVDRWCSLVETA